MMANMRWFACLIMQCLFLEGTCQVCRSGQDCPDNLPFCTSAGCVFRCPENTLINGTNCVEHCGKNFIYGNSCVSTCPTGYKIIEEKIVSISHEMYSLRYCLSQCRSGTFNYAGSCVVSCPSDSKFIDNGICAKQCPSSKMMRQNITFENDLLGIECVATCDISKGSPFQRGQECVVKCSDDEVVSKRKCMTQCPSDDPLNLDLILCRQLDQCAEDWPVQTYCSSSCPKQHLIDNNNCVAVCPEQSPYIYEGQCVSKCPDLYFAVKPSGILDNVFATGYVYSCLRECPLTTKHNPFSMECVNKCPETMKSFNNTCVFECPNSTFVMQNTALCVNSCNSFVFNKTCVDECPGTSKYIADGFCATQCPKSHPYTLIQEYYIDHTVERYICVNKCPSKANNVTFNCEYACPAKTKTYGSTCVKYCPPNTFLLTNEGFDISVEACVDICPKYYLNSSCVNECSKFVAVNACVDVCPENLKFAYKKACVSRCPNNTCLSDDSKTCSNFCAYDSSSNALVYNCPEHLPYFTIKDSQKVCVFSCENYQVIDNFTCINITDCKRAVLSKHRCRDTCLEGELYIPEKGTIKAVYDNDYRYQLDDANEDPCVTKFKAYTNMLCIGIFTVLYAVGLAVFLSTTPIPGCTCKKKSVINNQKETRTRTKLNKNEHVAVKETDDDVPLLSFNQGIEEVDIDKEMVPLPSLNKGIEEVEIDKEMVTLPSLNQGIEEVEIYNREMVPLLSLNQEIEEV